MTAPVIQFKRGIVANLPGLRAGEPGFTTDSYDLYVGLTSETQTNKFFGSHRYWTKETTSTGSGLNLVEGTSNGSDFITLKSPDSLSGIATYTFPESPTDGYFLKTNSTGTLSWAEVVSTFDIDADSGTKDTVSTGATITFAGGTNVNTAVTDDTITINLDDNPSVTNLNVSGITTLAGNVNLGDDGSDVVTVVGVATFTTSDVYIDNSLYVGGLQITGSQTVLGDDITTRNINASGITTVSTLSIAGIAVTAILDEDTMASDRADAIPTHQSVKAYVDTTISNVDLTIDTAGDSGTGSVSTSQSLSIFGTANEIETVGAAQSITVGLPDAVTVTTSLTTPTVQATNLKANDGTTAITITNSTGAVATNSDLTVGGNLYVNGSTTQFNTTSITVEDRTIELGLVNGSAPSSTTTWDLGVLFNYHATSAKKSAVVWEQGNARFKFASEVTDGGGTNNDSPQITFTSYAPIEISALWVTDCAGTSQVISCTGTERFLENITVDAGTF